MYFAGGYVYNNKVYGLSGRDAFLHSQFWFVDLRGLVTDGCYYSMDMAKVLLARSCIRVAHVTALAGRTRQAAQMLHRAGSSRNIGIRILSRACF